MGQLAEVLGEEAMRRLEKAVEARHVQLAVEHVGAKVAAGEWKAPMARMHKLGAIQLEKEGNEVTGEGEEWKGHILAQNPVAAARLGQVVGVSRGTQWHHHGLGSRGGGRGKARAARRERWACWRRCWGKRR